MAPLDYDLTFIKGSKEGSMKRSKTHRGGLEGDQVLVKITTAVYVD